MRTKLLLLVLALQTTWVVATVAVQEFKLHHGEVVLLEAARLDPRDYLRGDYVTLSYKIGTVPVSLFQGGLTNKPVNGMPVFVRLEKHGQFHVVERASLTPLQAERDHPVLQGKSAVTWFFAGANNASLRVDYGLERFYVQEGTGNPRGKLTVEAVIPVSGRAVIKQVYIDGKPYAEVMGGKVR